MFFLLEDLANTTEPLLQASTNPIRPLTSGLLRPHQPRETTQVQSGRRVLVLNYAVWVPERSGME